MNFFNWLTTSSVDPEKTALTVKSMLGYFIPLIVMGSQVIGHPIVQGDAENLVILITAGLTAVLQLYGIVRKIYYTFKK